MFSLIITIVSIALVVALVAATMYHGGDTLTQGRVSADAAAFVSGAQQVTGAAVMYIALEGTNPANIAALVRDKYLSSEPTVEGSWTALNFNADGTKTLTGAVNSKAVCDKLAADANAAYGCVAGATEADPGVFTFRF